MLAFTDEEVKERLNAVFAYRDKADIIAATGQNSTMVKENYNPESPRQSHAFLVLQHAVALAAKNEDRGDAFMRELQTIYEESKKRKPIDTTSDIELAKVAASANGVAIARLTKAPRLAQIIELGRTAKACADARKVLIEEMKMERLGLLTPEGIGNVQPVRDWAREIIEVRRSQ